MAPNVINFLGQFHGFLPGEFALPIEPVAPAVCPSSFCSSFFLPYYFCRSALTFQNDAVVQEITKEKETSRATAKRRTYTSLRDVCSPQRQTASKHREQEKMAIYHLNAKVISLSAGRRATAAAAYRAGAKIKDEGTGKVFDSTRKKEVSYRHVFAPKD
jgi:hypothetical protein